MAHKLTTTDGKTYRSLSDFRAAARSELMTLWIKHDTNAQLSISKTFCPLCLHEMKSTFRIQGTAEIGPFIEATGMPPMKLICERCEYETGLFDDRLYHQVNVKLETQE